MHVVKTLLFFALAIFLFTEVDSKITIHRRSSDHGMKKRDTETNSFRDAEDRGFLDDLFNRPANNRPTIAGAPAIGAEPEPLLPTVQLKPLTNMESHEAHRPSLLNNLLSGTFLDNDKDKFGGLDKQWVKYAIQKCAKIDPRLITAVLPTSSNNLREPVMYYFENSTTNAKTWFGAQEWCTARGMDLVTVNDVNENTVLQQKIKDILAGSAIVDPAATDNPNQFWIGYNDVPVDGIYSYIGDASSTFADWHKAAGKATGCVTYEQAVTADNIHFSDYACDGTDLHRFICEVSETCVGLLMARYHNEHTHTITHRPVLGGLGNLLPFRN